MGKIGPWRILRFFLPKLIFQIFQGFSTKNWKIVQFHHGDNFCWHSFRHETPISYESRGLEHLKM
jgi:hypothetical protein